MDLLRGLGTQLQALWGQMTPTWRAVVGVAAALCVAAIGWLLFVLMRTTYEPVLANASPEEVNAAAARLQARGIAYRLDAGGAMLSVPSERLVAARVELSGSAGAAGKGFELFDDSPLGMTPFIANMNYIRALQAELARSISQIEPVAQARVHIVLPEPSPFLREQKPTTASVVLKLKTGGRLNRSSADAIVALVSRAVSGLTPDNVTVVDTRGRLLTEARSADERATSGQLDYRRQLEAYLASKAEDILRQHLGVHRVAVRVAADVNFQHVKETTTTFNPEGKVVQTEKLVTEKSGGSSQPKGVAGTGSNLSRASASSSGAGGGKQSETTQTDYALSKTSREMENKLSGINRLTVAALVDLGGGEEGKKLSLADAQDLVKRAIGFKEGRDEIKVTDVGLGGGAAAPEETPPGAKLEDVLSIIRTGCLVMGLLLAAVVVILAWRWLSGRAAPAEAPTAPAASPSRDVEDFQNIARTDPERAARILGMLLGAPG